MVAQYVTAWAVRFYNGDVLLNTQYVQDGLAAVDPVTAGYISTPTKASTAQYNYTYSGWDQTFNRITMTRKINAVFSSTVRTYTVTFYNGSTVLQTVNNVAYGSSASYTGSTPVKSGVSNPDDYPFIGWNPTPTNITGNTSCYAQFSSPLEIAEITDSWEVILAAVADGTYKTKYSVGNYKALDLGAQGTINMQIAAFDADPLADGSGNAPISWVSKELLASTHRMNPSLSGSGGTFFRTEGTNTWTSKNQGLHSTTCTSTWTVVANAAGTLTITSTVNSESSDKLTVKVDGTTVVNAVGGSSKTNTHTVECTEGQSVTVTASYSKDSSVDSNGDTATIAFSATMDISITATAERAGSLTAGTGACGGWEGSEMRTYYKDTLKPLIPEVVRNAIKSVSKTGCEWTTAGKFVRSTSVEDVWMPSYREIFGGTSYEQSGPVYTTLFSDASSRIKKRTTSSTGEWWWLRSASSNYDSSFCLVNSNGINYYYNAYYSNGVALGFCT